MLGGCFGLIQLGVPYLIYAVGLKTCPPQRASLLTLIELAFCPLWAYLLVGEIPSAYGLASLLIITLGLASEALLKPSWEVTFFPLKRRSLFKGPVVK